MDTQYKELIKEILAEGYHKDDRTGVGSTSITGYMLKHDMSKGFPALTIRKVPYKSVRVELEGFIKGINSKKWYQERGCKFWDEWCNPKKVPYGNDPETKAKMLAEDDLGIIYGNNWRSFRDPSAWFDEEMFDLNSEERKFPPPVYRHFCGDKIDQFKDLIDTLKKDPNSRRMMVYAWNPLALDYAALPACHDSFQVTVAGGKINLVWRQRSVDVLLGLPANIASYATLLHLLALETGYRPGYLVGQLGDCHLYDNQIEAAKIYIDRKPYKPPEVVTKDFTSIYDWNYDQTLLVDYEFHPLIQVEVAV